MVPVTGAAAHDLEAPDDARKWLALAGVAASASAQVAGLHDVFALAAVLMGDATALTICGLRKQGHRSRGDQHRFAGVTSPALYRS